MHTLRRLSWIFLCGFVAVLGVSAALTVVAIVFDSVYKSKEISKFEQRMNSLLYVKNGEAEIKNLSTVPITRNAAFRGSVTNHWNKEFHSFRVLGEFKRDGIALFAAGENVDISVKPGETKVFYVVFRDIDAKLLTPDIQSELRIVWLKDQLL